MEPQVILVSMFFFLYGGHGPRVIFPCIFFSLLIRKQQRLLWIR